MNATEYASAGDEADPDDLEDSVLNEGKRLLADAERKLLAVERALARLDSGGYGTCEVCGNDIDPTALSAQPSLSRCEAHLERA